MFSKISVLVLFLICCFPTAYAQNKLSNKDIEVIKKIEETYRTAWLKNDEKTILALFWEDGMLYPNGNTIKGIEGMRKIRFAPSDTITSINTYQTKIDEIYGEKI